VPGLLVY